MHHNQDRFIVNCTRKGKRSSTYMVDFQYNQQLIDRIKTLPVKERAWSSLNKSWDVKVAGLLRIMSYYRKSDKIFFEFGGVEAKKIFIDQVKKIRDKERADLDKLEKLKIKNKEALELKLDLEKNYEKHSKLLHSFLKKGVKLYPHQIVGTIFLNYVKSALISLEMGLGKTILAITYCEMMGFHKVMVITPNSLKYNFLNEVEKFTHSPAHIINAKNNKYTIEEAKYVIVNYDYFRTKDGKKVDAKFKNLNLGIIDAVVADECQMIKSSKSNTYKNFKRIFKDIEYKVFLSGTPAPNRVHELYTVLNQISPIEFATKKFFYEYYCGMYYNPNTDFGDGWMREPNTARLEELFHKIAPYTYRKRKEEVLTDLPDKIYQKIMLDLDQIQDLQYEEIERGVANEIFSAEKLSGANALTIMLRLRQYTSMIKTNYIKELIDRLLDENQKVIVVDMFKDVLKEIQPMYPEISALHTGDVSVDERAKIVADFQNPNGKTKIFLASIQTANYGLTLTEASHMFIITLPFSVGQYDQVADRCILRGELVLTKKSGYIPIENVVVGDLVYTHKGNWKKVIATKNKIERKKPFYDIKYKGFYKPLRCTYDHEIYVYDKTNNEYVWVLAKDLDLYKHFMVLNNVNINNYDSKFIVKEYNKNKRKSHNFISINKNVKLTDDLLYAFGRFVGDGWVNYDDVSICGHIKEYENVKKCVNTLRNSFDIKGYGERIEPKDNRCTCFLYSKELTYNFELWFGKRAINKKIPEFIFHLSNHKIKSFLNGYYDADGYRRKNTQQASTVSKFLSYQLILLENMLGNTSSIRHNEAAKCWSFEYSINDKIKRSKLIKNDNGNVLYPIQEIKIYKPKRNDEMVYDLEVEDDSSFVVGLSTVHNCHRIGQKDTVFIYPLIFKGTIDEYVFSVIEDKRAEIMKGIDNIDYKSEVSESVLKDVINKLRQKYGN